MKRYWNLLQERLERLRANKVFETFVIGVIIASALLIGAKTYEEASRFDRILHWLDLGVTLFFLFEIIVRMAAEKRLLNFFRSGWNIFDFVIVVASLVPINDSEMVLVARLLRVFRVLRLVSMIPELRILLAALVKSIPRMGYVALLMFIIFYIYAAIGSFMFNAVDPVLWGNISIAMLTLFRVATFEDWTDVMYATMEVYPYSWVFYLTFIFLTAFVFLNMMIGIVLDVMQKESEAEQLESGQGEAAEVHWMRERMVQMGEQLDRMERQLEQSARRQD
ncbi:ion transporter [Marinobacterium sediminicola]|uniref:Voltage-gated sodium channel n=1 Tax=Marinobacterium sediminicola TaxID=518898 RepID=A0ABY1RVZ8_9GAMM|nr:ion transporter [Marinobacterium sediminicola]ULG70499.1 ion transporter [Marinobacterium sediminicola]SMR69173.1 voltage-gated sodium channel [Marinobacterium sediminicola]